MEKTFPHQSLGEYGCKLLLRSTMLQNDFSIVDHLSNEMILFFNMFSSFMKKGILGQRNCIIFFPINCSSFFFFLVINPSTLFSSNLLDMLLLLLQHIQLQLSIVTLLVHYLKPMKCTLDRYGKHSLMCSSCYQHLFPSHCKCRKPT